VLVLDQIVLEPGWDLGVLAVRSDRVQGYPAGVVVRAPVPDRAFELLELSPLRQLRRRDAPEQLGDGPDLEMTG